MESVPRPPALRLKESFETLRRGAAPRYAHVSLEGKDDEISVTDELSATGVRSLKVVDAPGLRARFNPHF